MTYRQRYRLSLIFLVLGLLIAFPGYYLEINWLLYAGIAVMLLAVLNELTLTCPNCHKPLIRRGVSPTYTEYCPSCGAKIDWDAKVKK